MSDADDKARDRADLLFFWERMHAVVQSTGYDGNAIGEAYRRYVLDLLRSRTPGPRMLQEVATTCRTTSRRYCSNASREPKSRRKPPPSWASRSRRCAGAHEPKPRN
jgi:hypothetical protein